MSSDIMCWRWRPWTSTYVLLATIFLHHSCYSEKAPYPTFAKDATEAPPILHYDYIIIGGGTSGCALAATLSEGANTLLLERGGLPYGYPTITDNTGYLATLTNLSPSSPSQTFVSTDGVINQRARVLGGGTALNAGFYSRADPGFFEGKSWDMKVVEESYEWVENKLVFKPRLLQWQSAVRDGLLEAGVTPDNEFTYEHINGTKTGGSIFDETGYRHTAADLLEYANPNNISVLLYATVHQILFTSTVAGKSRANGVLFTDRKGNKHMAYLTQDPNKKNEIILSAGALGSPQLLMLSGIGPSDHLKAHGIEVVLDQPMVGEGMADNPLNIIIVPTTRPVEYSLAQVVGIYGLGNYIEAASTPIDLDTIITNLEFFLTQNGYTVPPLPQTLTNILGIDPNLGSFVNVGIIGEKTIGPLSKGNLRLETTDPKDNPTVTFNYFQDPVDLARCVQGINILKKVIDSTALSKFRPPLVSARTLMNLMLTLPVNLRPRHVESLFSTEQYCKDTLITQWHFHGGAQVGHVIDHDYKVYGVDALRVIDGSTLLKLSGNQPSGNSHDAWKVYGAKDFGREVATFEEET